MNVLVLGDVGRPFHLGDEAMLEAALLALPHHHWTVLSHDPASTTARYGVRAVRQIGIRSEARLDEVVAAARGERPLAPDDPALDVLDAVAAADAVLIAGGGSLASGWSEHVFERSAVAAAAAASSTPLVVTGQGLGPALTARDGALVGAILTGAQLVGVREATSARIALQLGVLQDRLWQVPDDALTLPGTPSTATEPFVAVTLNPYAGLLDDTLEAGAALLDRLADLTGLDVLLVPHEGVDVTHHDALLTRVKSERVRALPLQSAREVAALTRQAALVVSNRYHPVVLALSGAVPVVGIAVDAYTEAKIAGSLAQVGLGSWCTSVLGLGTGVLADAVDEAWARRDEITAHLRPRVAAQEALSRAWWQAVDEALAGRRTPPPTPELDVDEVRAQGPWLERSSDALRWSRLLSARDLAWQQEREDLTASARGADDALQVERRKRREAEDEVIDLLEALTVERAAGDVARARNAELSDRDRLLAGELTAIKATKLWRWSRWLRSLYGRTR